MVDALSSGGSECMLVGFNSPARTMVKGRSRKVPAFSFPKRQ